MDYILENNSILLGLREKEGNLQFLKIYDKKTDTDFISDISDVNSLWDFEIKKDRDYFGEKITLRPCDCESYSVQKNKDAICFKYKNIKKPFMKQGFDVEFTVKIKDENSYYTIDISQNEEYGIWSVTCPRVSDLDVKQDGLYLLPFHGAGYPFSKFSENGFNSPMDKTGTKFIKEFGYWYPHGMQYSSFTKGKSTLYLSAEDKEFRYKYIGIEMKNPYKLNCLNVYHHSGKGIKGPWKNKFAFNMAIVAGDWYDSAKKYRKWGLENNIMPFSRGPWEDRKDIPKWLKETVSWFRVHCYMDNCYDSLNKSIDFMDVKCAIHFYQWPNYKYDTYYPTFLPVRKGVKEETEYLKNKGVPVMLYTNAHLVDTNNSIAYKKHGNSILCLSEHNDYIYESWAADDGACNKVACIGSEYYNILKEEYIKIMKELKPDAFYMDQVGGACHPFCFNDKHNHLPGADFANELYNKFIKEIQAEFTSIKGTYVPLATEEIIEPLDFDLWLHVNDPMGENEEYPISQIVYSGYKVMYGDQNRKTDEINEWKDYDSYPARNKSAISFVSGNMIGWNEGSEYEVFNEKFGPYFKSLAKAREKFLPFFNFGELMRKVKITSSVPEKRIKYMHWTGLGEFDFPIVKTGTYNYKNKTLIAFTNISLDEKAIINWETDPKSAGLEDKKSYKITKVYPNEEIIGESEKISHKFEINQLETIMYIIE